MLNVILTVDVLLISIHYFLHYTNTVVFLETEKSLVNNLHSFHTFIRGTNNFGARNDCFILRKVSSFSHCLFCVIIVYSAVIVAGKNPTHSVHAIISDIYNG